MKKLTPFILGLGIALVGLGAFLSSNPLNVGAASVVSLGKNGTSEYLLYPTDSLSAYTFIATSTTVASQFGKLTFTSATGTNATTSSLAVTNVTSALHLANATGGVTAYGGASCTNQFIRSLNGAGASTCASVANTDLTNSAITINGTSVSLGGSITVASTTLLADANTWSATNQFAKLTFTNATGTQATTTNLAISSVVSKILLANATGGVSGYAGSSCTNKAVTAISALGVATCSTITSSYVSLANLTATNASLTFSGTYTGATARTIGLNLGNANVWTALQTFNTAGLISTASSTIASLSSTKSTTTNATSTTGYFSGTLSGLQSGFTGRISPIKRLSYITATSTAWTATTSGAYLPPIISPFAGTIQTAQCSTDAGTLNVDVYHTTTHLALFNASTTVGTITFSSNNTVTNGEKIYISAGTPASTPTVLSCTLSITESL